MARRAGPKSDLINAAAELEAELGRFEEGVAGFTKLSLSSKKNLDRAGAMLEELAQSEQTMGARIQALVSAIQATRDRQLARVDVIREKAEELKTRSVEFRDLLVEFESLGTGAAALNAKLQGSQPAVVDVADEVTALGAKAQALVSLAKEKGFDDVAHLADGLRQQLTALSGRLASRRASQ
jgi:hypothetical protein